MSEKMDRLDLAALQERVRRLFSNHVKEVAGEFEEYGEVLNILWEEEFMVTCLRILEVAGKLPHSSIRTTFIQNIIVALVQPLGMYDVAGIFNMVQEIIKIQSRARIQVLPFGHQMQKPEDVKGQPGVF